MREITRALAYAMSKRYKRDAFIEYVDDYDDDTWHVLSRTREGRVMYALYRMCGYRTARMTRTRLWCALAAAVDGWRCTNGYDQTHGRSRAWCAWAWLVDEWRACK